MHYCMDKLVDWSIGHTDEKNHCNNCGMEKDGNGKNACCKDEQKQLKIEKDQKTTPAFEITFSSVSALPVSYYLITFTELSSVTEEYPLNNAPPRTAVCPVYIRNCIFLI